MKDQNKSITKTEVLKTTDCGRDSSGRDFFIWGKLRGAARRTIDLLFPPSIYCSICGNIIDETRTYELCDHCIKHIQWDIEEPVTIPLPGSGGARGLTVLSCAEYGIYERTLIFNLKYSGRKYIARDIARMMRDRLAFTEIVPDIVVPVPASPERAAKRGFDQAALIGRYLAELMGISYCSALRRVRETKAMRGLSKIDRRENVRGAFAPDENARTIDFGKRASRSESGETDAAGSSVESISRAIKGKHVLLVDDIFTTGATALECAGVISAYDPSEISFLSFAARPPEDTRYEAES